MSDADSCKLNAVLDAMEDGIYIIASDYTIEFMNRRMQETFGDGTGKKCHEVIHNLSEPCPWCARARVLAGETVRQEVFIPPVDKVYEITEFPLRNEDGSASMLSIYRDVTFRKQSEKKLKTTEESFKSLFEHVGCGVYLSTREGRFLDANRALWKTLGYGSKEEFLKIDIARDLYLKPEDRRAFQDRIERDGHVLDHEVTFRRKDGAPMPVLLTAHGVRDEYGNVMGYEGIMTDQTMRKRMEKELRDATIFLSKLIQSSPNAIMAADMKGNILIWNRAAEEILGYKAGDVIGRMNIEKVYPEGMARQVMKMLRSSDYGGVGVLRSHPLLAVNQDGRTVDADLSAAVIYDEKGREMATVGIMVDVSSRMEMERKLRQIQEQLLQSEKLAAMGRLTSQIAHELNNPLYGIMNTLELLKSEVPATSKRRKILEMALSETVRLTDMLRKMLIFSKPDQEARQETDLNAIMDELLLLYGKQLSEYSVKVAIDFAENLPTVKASRNQLRQVFLNMITNARDAMPEGGVLTVRTFARGEFACVAISDTGCGIKPEHLDKIFEAFFTTKESIKGVGLGLSVCYGFIRDHGGDISVESTPGEGTTFTVSLPAV